MSATDLTDQHELHGAQAVLFVTDVRKTLDFYRDVLGFHIDFESGDPPTHARVSSGDRNHASAARIRFQAAPAGVLVVPSCYLYVHVGRLIDGYFQMCRDRGVKIVSEPNDRPWGLREFEISDCNGYKLTFAAEW